MKERCAKKKKITIGMVNIAAAAMSRPHSAPYCEKYSRKPIDSVYLVGCRK